MSAPRRYPLLSGDPPELLVHDEVISCPYLHDEQARMPLRLPVMTLTAAQLDARLALGERRQGRLVYRAECPRCTACEALRIPVADFRLGRSHRRVWRRGREQLEVALGPPRVDARRVALYNKHKRLRGLTTGDEPMTEKGYHALLADSCCDSFELRYVLDGELVGVAIADRGERSLSAVYCYYDPDHGGLSLGTFSILYQLELCRRWKLDHLYLGLTIDACRPMTYKTRFLPHERLTAGRWHTVERA